MNVRAALSPLPGCSVLLFALLACKRSHGESPAEKAADEARETKEVDRANKVLQTLASFEAKVKTLGSARRRR